MNSRICLLAQTLAIASVVCCTNAAALTGVGLVGLWRADGNSMDSAGTVDGTWNGTPGYEAGTFDQAFNFTDSGNYITLPDDSFDDVLQGGALTVSAWLNMSPSVNTDASAVLFEQAVIIYFDSAEPGVVTAVFDGSFGTRLSSGVAINDNEWHHVVITIDQGTANIYVDGMLENTGENRGIATTGLLNRFSGGYFAEISGLVDEIAIYNRALSGQEVKDGWEERIVVDDIFADSFEPNEMNSSTMTQ